VHHHRHHGRGDVHGPQLSRPAQQLHGGHRTKAAQRPAGVCGQLSDCGQLAGQLCHLLCAGFEIQVRIVVICCFF